MIAMKELHTYYHSQIKKWLELGKIEVQKEEDTYQSNQLKLERYHNY